MEFSTSAEIEKFCDFNNISCSPEIANKFDVLSEMLVKFNSHTNVTALKTPEDIAIKHFIDSLYVLKYDVIKQGASVVDIGCGAGFPGLPVKILRPDISMTFVDSTAKKLRFTSQVIQQFDLSCCEVLVGRAEEIIDGRREKYDVAVSRAVASMQVLLELVMPYVAENGIFVAYKSAKEADMSDENSELSRSANALRLLGGKVEDILDARLDDGSEERQNHALIIIRKTRKTSTEFPRRYSSMLKRPL